MTSTADLLVRLSIVDANAVEQEHVERFYEALAILAENGKRERVDLINGNTALVVPTGATGVIILPVSGAFTTTLKGANADTGIIVATTAVMRTPIVLPLGTTPTIVLTCTGTAVVEVVWF